MFLKSQLCLDLKVLVFKKFLEGFSKNIKKNKKMKNFDRFFPKKIKKMQIFFKKLKEYEKFLIGFFQKLKKNDEFFLNLKNF